LTVSEYIRQAFSNRYRDEWFNAFIFYRIRPPVQVSNTRGSIENVISCQT